MSKLARKLITGTLIRRVMRRNPYALGVTAALLAAGGVAAAASKNPRIRQLSSRMMRRFSAGAPNAQLDTPNDPY